MRKALVIGIDHYEHIEGLKGCVNDAQGVKAMLERHGDRDGSVNFGVRLMVGDSSQNFLKRSAIKEEVRQLFADDHEIALLYFAGHGHIESTGGYLCAGDCQTGDDGLPLADILTYANQSKARNKVIILDSCHSGIAGDRSDHQAVTEIADGVTILTASTKDQYAEEIGGGGVFTGLLIDALGGAAANLVGEITPGSVYAHIDQSLGSWAQRPVFKTNVKTFVSLRRVQPPLPFADLRRIAEFFPVHGHAYSLDPSYEPKSTNPEPRNTAIFAILQKYNRVNLLVPVDAPHMYDAAMETKAARLTTLGEHYRRLVEKGLI